MAESKSKSAEIAKAQEPESDETPAQAVRRKLYERSLDSDNK